MQHFTKYVILILSIASLSANHPAWAQSVDTYTSLATYNAALPATSIVSHLEDFSSVTTNTSASQTTGDNWDGFSVVAAGTSPYGSAGYCPSLDGSFFSTPTACMDYNAFAPNVPGLVGAFAEAISGGGELTFTPTGEAIAFAFDYVDWNDTDGSHLTERSAFRVFLSDGTSEDIDSPPLSPDAPIGFLGLILDDAAISSGVSITSIFWYGVTDELVGLFNIRTIDIVRMPVLNLAKTSAVWDPLSSGKLSLPQEEIYYTLTLENHGNGATDPSSLFILDDLPPDLEFWNGDIDAGGSETFPDIAPIGFQQLVGTGVSFDPATDLRYSSGPTSPTDFDDCTTIPLDGSFRSDIRYICIRPQGALTYGTSSPTIEFYFRARIR